MPIISSFASAAARAYGWCSSKIKILITDNFNRANGPLGNTNTGQAWEAINGTWAIVSNQASSSDAGSTYPVAAVNLQSYDGIVSANITDGGPGVVFWLTSANSWWASSVNYRSTSEFTGTTQSGGGYYANGFSISGYTCPSGCFYSPAMGECLSNIDESYCGPGTPVYVCNAAGSTCNYIPPFTFCGTKVGSGNCNSVTTYITELKLYSNVAGTISTAATQQIASNTSSYTKANSMKVVASGNSITVTGYSSAGLVSQLGSPLTNTPSSPIKGTKVGIIKTPSTANQGSALDNFSAENIIS